MTLSGDNVSSMKHNNRKAVLTEIRLHSSQSRKHLARALHLTPAAISNIVAELIEEGLLVESEPRRAGGVGRSQIMLEINRHARCGLGILIHIGTALISGVWLDGSSAFSAEVRFPPNAPAQEVVDLLVAQMQALVEANGLDRRCIVGLGVAIRGMIDKEKRIVVDSLGVFDGRDIPLAALFERASGLPVMMDNNVRALFAAQLFLDCATHSESQFFLRCEYGIGGALSINDEIWIGGKGHCSEIGHIQVVRRGGRPCTCGKSGCLETVASPAAILSEALRIKSPRRTPLLAALAARKPQLGFDDVVRCAANGDAGAAYVVERAVRAMGQAIKSIIYIIDPQRIVLYGNMFENDRFLAQLMVELRLGCDKDHEDIIVEKSAYNKLLDPVAAGILSVQRFFADGGQGATLTAEAE